MRVYVDTNIIIDYLQGRDSRSYKFFKDSINCRYILLFSTLTIHELRKYNNAEMLFETLMQLDKLEIISVTEQDKKEASQDTKTHISDAIHIVLAIKYNADMLLTNNLKDFKHCSIARGYSAI